MTRTALETLGDLEVTLGALTDALARRDIDALLAVEPRLALVAAEVSRIAMPPRSERSVLEPALERAAGRLSRCEAVGRAAAELTADLLACATLPAYARSGLARPPAPARVLDARL